MIRHRVGGMLMSVLGGLACAVACSDDKPKSESVGEGTSGGGTAGARASGGAAGSPDISNAGGTSSTGSINTAATNSTTSGTTSGGAASTKACDPASEVCSAGAPAECSDCGDAGVGEVCETDSDCESGICLNMACGECMPGALTCDGVVPQTCSPVGRWLRQPACSDDAPYCLEGQCVGCVDGQTRPCADCSGLETCEAHTWGACEAIMPASCEATPDCNSASCCEARLVEGGTFYFGPLLSYAATVTNYCLDRYEVSVGRFRTFLNAYDQWQPTPGAGEHLPGAGTGWQPEWTKGNELPLDAAAFIDNVMSCDYATFSVTPNADASETLPQNCLTWHEAQAFCIWDGGRLATEAEWEYAAGGGEEERTYPWGDEPPDSANAVFDCCGDGDCETCSVADILPVGNKAAGEGRFGQADLAGNLYEWVLDGYAMIDFRPYPCVDCAVVPNGTTQVQRGGGYAGDGLSLQVVARPTGPATTRSDALGARCVRKR